MLLRLAAGAPLPFSLQDFKDYLLFLSFCFIAATCCSVVNVILVICLMVTHALPLQHCAAASLQHFYLSVTNPARVCAALCLTSIYSSLLNIFYWSHGLSSRSKESKSKQAEARKKKKALHFVGRSSFRLPRFLRGGVRLSSLSFSESCSSRLGRNPFSWERLRLWTWELSSARQEEGSLGIPFSTSHFSCFGKQASDVLSLCPPMSPLWTCAMDALPIPV